VWPVFTPMTPRTTPSRSSQVCNTRPSAIVAVSDLVAAGVCAAAAQRGLRVPHDLSVTGFDDLEVAQLLSPPLTTVHQDPYALGALAADVVRALVDGGHAESALVAPDLTVRGSTGPAETH
jgi:DNA-binding LacI/PurR family transcriptional regulator